MKKDYKIIIQEIILINVFTLIIKYYKHLKNRNRKT